MTDKRKRIVVIGASFAGLTAATKLSKRHAVTVIDPVNEFEWVPNIHELLSGVKTPRSLRLDRAAIIRRAGHRFVQDSVSELDPDARRLSTAGGLTLDFDLCIVALGAALNTHGFPGVDRQAIAFRSIADAVSARQRLDSLSQDGNPPHIVIAGGGVVGVEVLGEIMRTHRNVPGLRIDTIEPAGRLLPMLPSSLDADLRALCAAYPVRVRVGTAITRVTPKGVQLSDGSRLHSALTLWTAGMAPPPLLSASGLARSAKQPWAEVRPTLQSRHHSHVFVIGDAAAWPRKIGKQAYHAIDMGEHAAANAERLLAGKPLNPFKPRPRTMLISFGDLQTYLVAGQSAFASPLLAGAKEAVYQVFMAQMAPGGLTSTLTGAARRLGRGWQSLALPQLRSLAERRKLPDLRRLGTRKTA